MTTSALTDEMASTMRRAEGALAESRRVGSRNRACRRHVRRTLDQVTEAVDVLQARRTVPRGDDARDWSRRPGVPLPIWLLHVRYARSGSAEDLGALVAEYEQYALSLARRLRRDREPSDDLDQVARESLVVALQRFDCERGLPFPAFATPTILGALRRHYRDHGWSIRVPRKVHEMAVPAREATDRLTTELGRPPTADEVAQELGIETADLLATQQAAAARTPASLDSTPTVDGPSQHEVIGDDDRNLLVAEDQVVLSQAIEHLGERDRDVIRLYFFEELTQSQIAERYGVSQMQVSRWIASIVKRLRSHMQA
ncbi:MAG TPA: sigma-70 family RNA polymerase sigma factor [Iamia sp.]|nr:sigma-70 family RNA polymerase sigma factor [Iamia sp.]